MFPLELLSNSSNVCDIKDDKKKLFLPSCQLQQILEDLGIKASIIKVENGVMITRYVIQPEQGVRISDIRGLEDDINICLGTYNIRIEAPIPGTSEIGIEVPNKEGNIVHLRDVLACKKFDSSNSDVSFAIGSDISGTSVIGDLVSIHHLFVAGCGGAGKSVCIHSIIMSILSRASSEDVKFIMLDPIIAELSIYNGIPHLLIPVVTDLKKASAALNWAVNELNDRYRRFGEAKVRDFQDYKELIKQNSCFKKMPRLVIVIDSFEEIMKKAVSVEDIVNAVDELTRNGAKFGVHLVVSCGDLFKSDITDSLLRLFPSRIAFHMNDSEESKRIVNMNGAEKLLGKGDMLFYPPFWLNSITKRIQGAWVDTEDIRKVVEYLKNFSIEVNTEQSNDGVESERNQKFDALLGDVGRFAVEKEKVSIGMIQRLFKLGFTRSAKILDQLYEMGVVGPEEGLKPRAVLMTMDEFEETIKKYNIKGGAYL